MADELSHVQGLAELRKRMAQLDDKVANKLARRSVATATNVVKKEARRIVKSQGSVKSGALHRNIVLKRERKVPKGRVQYHVGVRHGRRLGRKAKQDTVLERSKKTGLIVTKYRNDPYYWRFIEFGHKTVPRRGGKHSRSIAKRRKAPTGYVAAKPFIGPALVAKRREAQDKMRDVLKQGIIKQGGYQYGR